MLRTTKISTKRIASRLLLGWLCLALASCGGSERTTVAAPASPPSGLKVHYGMKTYDLSWHPVADARWYEVVDVQEEQRIALWTTFVPAWRLRHASLLTEVAGHRYVVRACNEAGCGPDSAAVVPDANQAIALVRGSNTESADSFGARIALSRDGRTMAIGARAEQSGATGVTAPSPDNSADAAGAVYVYVRGDDGRWVEQAYLKASNARAGDRFGNGVALSADGNTLAVGAYQEDSNGQGVGADQDSFTLPNSGAVYIFTRQADGWQQQAYLKASNADANDWFGVSVRLSGDGTTLAVAAIGEASSSAGIGADESDNGTPNAGAVYIFRRLAGGWSQEAYLKSAAPNAGDQFGSGLAISMDGETVAVGAPLQDAPDAVVPGAWASSAGAVHVFRRTAPGSWGTYGVLHASDVQPGGYFGATVALSADGQTLIAGAPGSDSVPGASPFLLDAGAAYVFQRTPSEWIHSVRLTAPHPDAGDWFGGELSLSANGEIATVAAIYESGSSIGIGGDPASNEVPSSGAVYVFRRKTGDWSPVSYVKALHVHPDTSFGMVHALSADGGLLAVGCPATAVLPDPSTYSDWMAKTVGAVCLY